MRGSVRGAPGNWRPYRDRARTTCEAAEQARGGAAEAVEGRGLPEGNTVSETRPGRSAGLGVSSDLDRVRQVARKDKDVRFTALLHHVNVDRLREAYRAFSPTPRQGSMGSRGRITGWTSKRTFAICMPGFSGGVSGEAA